MSDPVLAANSLEAGGWPARLGAPPRGGWWWAAAAGLVVAVSLAAILPDGPVVNGGGWSLLLRFIGAAARPEVGEGLAALALRSAAITLAYAVAGSALSLAIGLVLGVLSSETWWRGRRGGAAPLLAVRAALAVPRGIHEGIWGLIFINIFGLDPIVAVLAIAVPYGAITAKVYAEIIDEAPAATRRALEAAGAGRLVALTYGTLPPAFAALAGYAMYRFECAVRAAALLGLIGAGGLGYQILLSLQSLRLEQVWTFLYVLIALVAVVDASGSLLVRALDVTASAHDARARRRPSAATPLPRPAVATSARMRVSAALLLAGVALATWHTGADFGRLGEERTGRLLARVAEQAWPPALDWASLAALARLSAETLAMSVVAIAIAAGGGFLLSLPATVSVMLPRGEPRGLATTIARGAAILASRLALLVTRSLAEPIWALLVLLILFPGPLAGAVGLGLYNLGVLGRLMAEAAEAVDQRPAIALRAQGAPPTQLFAYAILPATIGRSLALALYRFEVCVRATAIVGVVGAGGLGRRLAEELTRFDYPSALATLLAYIALTLAVDLASAALRRRLR